MCGTVAARFLSTAQTFQVLSFPLLMLLSLVWYLALNPYLCFINCVFSFNNKVSTFVAVLGAVYMQIFLRDSVVDENQLYTPIISQGKPPTAKINGKSKANMPLLKALSSLRDLTSFLNSRCANFHSYTIKTYTFRTKFICLFCTVNLNKY